jgi:plasmid stabilization system protein ParE
MRRRLRYSPAYIQELQSAIDWYAKSSARVVNEFCVTVKATIRSIAKNAERFSRVRPEGETRFARLGRFPWLILFRIRRGFVVIGGIVHGARDIEGRDS